MSSTQTAQTARPVMPCGCCIFPRIHNENSVCDIIEYLRKAGTDNEILAFCLVGTLGTKESLDLVQQILAQVDKETVESHNE